MISGQGINLTYLSWGLIVLLFVEYVTYTSGYFMPRIDIIDLDGVGTCPDQSDERTTSILQTLYVILDI